MQVIASGREGGDRRCKAIPARTGRFRWRRRCRSRPCAPCPPAARRPSPPCNPGWRAQRAGAVPERSVRTAASSKSPGSACACRRTCQWPVQVHAALPCRRTGRIRAARRQNTRISPGTLAQAMADVHRNPPRRLPSAVTPARVDRLRRVHPRAEQVGDSGLFTNPTSRAGRRTTIRLAPAASEPPNRRPPSGGPYRRTCRPAAPAIPRRRSVETARSAPALRSRSSANSWRRWKTAPSPSSSSRGRGAARAMADRRRP